MDSETMNLLERLRDLIREQDRVIKEQRTRLDQSREDYNRLWDELTTLREERKSAAHKHRWLLGYPLGESTYNGSVMDNAEIAKDLFTRLQGGGIAMPLLDGWKLYCADCGIEFSNR